MMMIRKREKRLVLAIGFALLAVVTAPALWAQAPSSTPPPSVTVIGASEAHGVLGRDVRGPADEDMGPIVDVIVDRAATVRAAVIDFGGFLGVGSRKIVVDWNALHFGQVASKKDAISLELTKEQVMAARNTRRTRRSWCLAPPEACNRSSLITDISEKSSGCASVQGSDRR